MQLPRPTKDNGSMTVKEERDAQKQRWQQYRDAVKKLFPTATVNPLCAVNETANKDGAFIEVVVWVPRTALDLTNET